MKPLICPSCFSQVAFKYKQSQGQYEVDKPENVVANETKIIRNRDAEEQMSLSEVPASYREEYFKAR